MYSDRKKKLIPLILLLLCAVAVIWVIFASLFSGTEKKLSAETRQAITDTIQQTALQCYIVEGCYPENLQYLEENYGLRVNTKKYLIDYEAYASNEPPVVQVLERK